MLRFKKMEISWGYERYLKTVEFRIYCFATASSTQTVCHNGQTSRLKTLNIYIGQV